MRPTEHSIHSPLSAERSGDDFRQIIEAMPEGYCRVLSSDWRIVDANTALCDLLKRPMEELLGQSMLALVAERQRESVTNHLRALRSGAPSQLEVELSLGDAASINVQLRARVVSGGEAGELFVLFSDRTAHQQREQELRLAATFFESTSEAITVTDADNRIIAVNPAFCWITGYREEEVIGKNPSMLSSGRHSAAFYRSMWETLQRLGRWQGEIWNRRRNGEVFPEWLSIVAIKDGQGKVVQHMAIFSDISKRKQDEKKIWQQANYDALTGLPNRTLFLDRLSQAMHQAHRDGRKIALLFIDLDRFKYVNDTLGHTSGDQLLRETGQRITRCVSESDTVARLGGDEFAVVMNNATSVKEVQKVAENILSRLLLPFDVAGRECFVSGSIGITIYPDDATEMEQLLRNADSSMYRAKEAGRNTLRYYTQEMNEVARRRLRLESDLRRALDNEELEVHYQPIVDASGKVVGAEALTRWQHRELGPVPPDEFILLAEEIGIIAQIEQWVMATAVREVGRWFELMDRELFVSVNISGMQCKSIQCYEFLHGLLQRSNIKPSQLKLEITERVMMDQTESVIELLLAIRSTGIQLAVDDFGTGYSSLSYLKRFPVNVLKIDRSFVSGLPEDRDDMGLVEAIVAMAKSLDLRVVAEGVETHEQLTFLHSLGVDLVQGYYYSPALPADQFCAYLAINSGRHLNND